jgi:low temperature requirement protein LtrA
VWWIYFRHLERAIGHFGLGSGQPYIFSHIPFWIGIIMMSVGTRHAIMESHLAILSSGTVRLLLAGGGVWGAGGFLMDYVTGFEEARSAPYRYVGMAGMIIFLSWADIFLSPVMMIGLMSACFFLLLFIHERKQLNDSVSEEL